MGLTLSIVNSSLKYVILNPKGWIVGRKELLILGLLIVVSGFLVLSGYDKQAEAYLVETSPDWLTELTTRF